MEDDMKITVFSKSNQIRQEVKMCRARVRELLRRSHAKTIEFEVPDISSGSDIKEKIQTMIRPIARFLKENNLKIVIKFRNWNNDGHVELFLCSSSGMRGLAIKFHPQETKAELIYPVTDLWPKPLVHYSDKFVERQQALHTFMEVLCRLVNAESFMQRFEELYLEI